MSLWEYFYLIPEAMEKVWQHPIFPRYIGTRCIVCIGTIHFKTSADIDILLGHSLGVQFWQNILHYILAIFSRVNIIGYCRGSSSAITQCNALFIARRPLLFPSLSKSYSVAYEFCYSMKYLLDYQCLICSPTS